MDSRQELFSPIKGTRAFEEVAERIKELILNQDLKPGDRLPPETQLAKQFQVGRQTMREAFRLLEMSGLITIQKGGGGGAFVNDTIHHTIRDLFMDAFRLRRVTLEDLTQARIEIEGLVLSHALRNRDQGDLDALRENLTRAGAKIADGLPATDENVEFHLLLAEASKNFVYVIVMQCLMAVHANLLHQGGATLETSSKVVEAHQKMLDAIESRNEEKANNLSVEHLIDVQTRLIKAERASQGEENKD